MVVPREARPEMWAVLSPLRRYIATPTVAKHRLFVWLPASVCPDHQLIAVGRDDDVTLGILHSRFHELWSLRMSIPAISAMPIAGRIPASRRSSIHPSTRSN